MYFIYYTDVHLFIKVFSDPLASSLSLARGMRALYSRFNIKTNKFLGTVNPNGIFISDVGTLALAFNVQEENDKERNAICSKYEMMKNSYFFFNNMCIVSVYIYIYILKKMECS
jgi:hypothetical protein